MLPQDWILFWISLKNAINSPTLYPDDHVAFDVTFTADEAIDLEQHTALRDSCEQMIPREVRQYFGIIDIYIRFSVGFYPDNGSDFYEMILMWRRDEYNPFDDNPSNQFVID